MHPVNPKSASSTRAVSPSPSTLHVPPRRVLVPACLPVASPPSTRAAESSLRCCREPPRLPVPTSSHPTISVSRGVLALSFNNYNHSLNFTVAICNPIRTVLHRSSTPSNQPVYKYFHHSPLLHLINLPYKAGSLDPASSKPIGGVGAVTMSSIETSLTAFKEASSLIAKFPYISPVASLLLQVITMQDISV
jgi:hypothetical protein